MKTSTLKGAQLDWAVAKCENEEYDWWARFKLCRGKKSYSIDWSQGGPIIERENISFRQYYRNEAGGKWYAKICRESGTLIHWMGWGVQLQTGTTPLEAAMRCYVASKLGDEVEIPEELI